MDGDAIVPPWHASYERAKEQVRARRTAHPRATFTEIEAALDAASRVVLAELSTDLVAADPAGQVAGRPAAERPHCPDCGGRVVSLGQRTRQVLVDGDQAAPISRTYARCPRCGVGHVPPG